MVEAGSPSAFSKSGSTWNSCTAALNLWNSSSGSIHSAASAQAALQLTSPANSMCFGHFVVRVTPSSSMAAVTKLAFDVIPQDPSKPEYRQGGTLGEEHKHWFRAKFFQQYRLFFRYHGPSKIIILAWVNDEDTKRAYESSDDAYRVFRKMLASGHPPDSWDKLLKEATQESARLNSAAASVN